MLTAGRERVSISHQRERRPRNEFQRLFLPLVAFGPFGIGVGELPSDPGPGQVADRLMEVERELKTLLTRHRSEEFDLIVRRRFRGDLAAVRSSPKRGPLLTPST